MTSPTDHATSIASPTCVILNIGDELLAGDVVNSNQAFMAARAHQLGFVVRQAFCVRDRVDEIVAILRRVAGESSVCLVSGGLGPTSDDLTAAAIAAAAGVELERDLEAVARLEEKFRRVGRTMAEINKKQADFPAGSSVLPNPLGSAEGFTLRLGGCHVFATPGVPREMKKMMVEQIEPRLRETFSLSPVPRRVYRVLGMGESSIAEIVEPLVAQVRGRSPQLAGMFVHYRASTPEVTIVLEALPASDGAQASLDDLRVFDPLFLQGLGPALYGIGTAELAPRLLKALTEAGLRLATAESCTGGAVSASLAAIPGASAALEGGIISYSNAIKTKLLGVPEEILREHGAVSEPTARAMAIGARAALGSDLSVSVTGIAGPTGGSAEKPVGTVHFGVFDGEVFEHKQLHLFGPRGTVQRAAQRWALKLVWDRLVARGLAQVIELDQPDGGGGRS